MADAPYSHNIRQLTKDAYDNSFVHGFWDNDETIETVPSKLMLIVSEAAEALESYRDPKADFVVKVPVELYEWLLVFAESNPVTTESAETHLSSARTILEKWKVKPKGIETELADILIRVFDLAGRKGIDLDRALREKMEYNKGRPAKHGRVV